MDSKRSRYRALVGAAGVVFGMGGWIANLYPGHIATFGMIAIFILGGAAVQFLIQEDE